MKNMFVVAAFLGFLSVVIGASGSHLLDADGEALRQFEIALRYHQLYSVLLVGVGLVSLTQIPLAMQRILLRSGLLFTVGVLVFSGSLYLLSFSSIVWLGYFTPIGGVLLMLGWLNLIFLAFKK